MINNKIARFRYYFHTKYVIQCNRLSNAELSWPPILLQQMFWQYGGNPEEHSETFHRSIFQPLILVMVAGEPGAYPRQQRQEAGVQPGWDRKSSDHRGNRAVRAVMRAIRGRCHPECPQCSYSSHLCFTIHQIRQQRTHTDPAALIMNSSAALCFQGP